MIATAAVPAQYNWITGGLEVFPEQLVLELPVADDVVLPGDDRAILLATENGSQLYVSGFGLFVGKKSERVVVRQGKETCAEVPLMKLQEIIVGSKGVSLSSDLILEACERGIRIGCLKQGGQPYALITSPMLTASVETRREQFAAAKDERGVELCKWLVAGKVNNQEKLLRYFGKSREEERRAPLLEAAGQLRRIRKQALGVEGRARARFGVN